jgi:hypothetical protein
VEDTVLDPCAAAPDDARVIGFLTLSVPRLTNAKKLKQALDQLGHCSISCEV